MNLAKIARTQGEWKEALGYLEEAISINPYYPGAIDVMENVLTVYPDPEAANRLQHILAVYHPERNDLEPPGASPLP